MKRPIAIDLFSGCGGMSLGLEASGFDIAAAVEFDAIHTLVHHFNFPYGVSICQNISELSSQALLKAIEDKGFSRDIDLIAGGPPCQGFSHIGKRQLDDPRNSLVFEYLRIIKEIKPKYFIFENVPGIASGNHQKFLQELIVEFEKIGYSLDKPVSILDASLYGAPQKRKRLILVGSRLDVNKAIYPQPTHTEMNLSEPSLSDSELLPLSTCGNAIGDLMIYAPYTNGDDGIDSFHLDYSGFRNSFALKPSGEFNLCHNREVSHMVYGHIGSKHTKKSIDRFYAVTPGTIEKTSRFFKLAVDGQCNTLRAGTPSDRGAYTAPRPIHYLVPRCITIREAARLHTFPDWFRFHNTIWHGFREIGNAVIPFLAKSLGEQIIKAMALNSHEFEIYTLEEQDDRLLNYNMGQASNYWNIADDVIPKRKKVTTIYA
jgi:DNA (cytosine-5)-methyltransferase 1